MSKISADHQGVYFWRPWYPPGVYAHALGRYFTADLKGLSAEVEGKLAQYLGSKHVILMPSGTTAIYTALRVLLPDDNNEVLLPSLVCEVVPFAVKAAGKIPRFLEIKARTFNVDEELIESKINGRTQAIIAVHQFGTPCDLAQLSQIAKKHHLLLIEDAAQAFGAEYGRKKVGTLGDIGIISFNNKVIDACGGGAIVTNNDDIVAGIRRYRDEHYPLVRKGFWRKFGRCWLLVEHPQQAMALAGRLPVTAMLGIPQDLNVITLALLEHILPSVDSIIAGRRENFNFYDEFITAKGVIKPSLAPGACGTFYTIMLPGCDRDKIQQELLQKGIQTLVLADSTHRKYQPDVSLPVTDTAARSMLSFPTHGHLGRGQIRMVAETVNSLCEGAS